jgi:hypothetical protein
LIVLHSRVTPADTQSKRREAIKCSRCRHDHRRKIGVMITSRVPVEARFKRVAKDEDGTERTWFHVEPVVAFDGAGEPLVVEEMVPSSEQAWQLIAPAES